MTIATSPRSKMRGSSLDDAFMHQRRVSQLIRTARPTRER
jgi:hypothetical protein